MSVALAGLSAWRQRTERREQFQTHAQALVGATAARLRAVAGSVRALDAHWRAAPPEHAEDFQSSAQVVLEALAEVDGLLWCEPAAEAGGRATVRFAHPSARWRDALGVDPSSLLASGGAPFEGVFATTFPTGSGAQALLIAPADAQALDAGQRSSICALVGVERLAASVRAQPWALGLELYLGPDAGPPPRDVLEHSAALPLAPPSWFARVRAGDAFDADRRPWMPWALLAIGATLTAFLTHRIRALELRGRALSRVNAELYSEIGERHSAESRLREAQRALATLVANLPGMTYRCRNSPDWPMEFISDGCGALTGHPARDFVEGVVSYGQQVIHPDDRQYVWNAVQQAVEAHRPFQLVYRIVTSGDRTKWVWEQGRGVYSRADELLALEGLVNDITERKLAEEGFKREMRFVAAIIDSLPGVFYVFDESGRFVRWNQNVEAVTGYSPLELAAMSPRDFFDGEDRERVERAVRQVFEEGRAVVEARLRSKHGDSIPFHFTGVLFSHDGARYLVGTGVDVSEREQALEERRRVHAQLLHTSKLESLGVMASSIAHDFNNMLTVVAASAGMAQSAVDPGSEAHGLLQQALSATQNASEITRQLASLARGDAQPRGALSLSELVRSLERLLRSSIKRRVQIEYDLAQELPPVQADGAQLRQLVLNLALNAGEACLARGGTVLISTGVRSYEAADLTPPAFRGSKRSGRHVFVQLSDNGEGMDEATLARLGEPFFTTRVAGRGLGMAAALGILRSHGGWLELHSSPGEGTNVRACLPVD